MPSSQEWRCSHAVDDDGESGVKSGAVAGGNLRQRACARAGQLIWYVRQSLSGTCSRVYQARAAEFVGHGQHEYLALGRPQVDGGAKRQMCV